MSRGYPITKPMHGERQERAEKRNALWAELTPAEQLRDLDRRLGKGVGAKKQRVRLAKIVRIDSMEVA